MQLQPSVRQWALSFLAVDAVHWGLVGISSLVHPTSAFENLTFVPFFYYLPFSLIARFPLGPVDSVVASTLILAAFGVCCHVLIGGYVGHRLQTKKFAWVPSILIAAGLTVTLVIMSIIASLLMGIMG